MHGSRAAAPLDPPAMSPHAVDLSNSDRIRVVVRCRPRKKSEAATSFVTCENDGCVSIQTSADRPRKEYHFDYVAGGDSTQELLYAQAGRPVVDCALTGFHGTIFAYGQTGTGKTWSTSGPPGAKSTSVPDARGVIPRACEAIFEHIAENSCDTLTFKARASYLEIYNEKIRDLLADPKHPPPPARHGSIAANKGIYLRETASGEVLVEGGRRWVNVATEEQCIAVLSSGVANRAVGSTAMNAESSRSHAIFTIEISQTSAETMKERVSQLHLVDLAGSERQKSTQAQGDRLKESNEINKSLTSLGNVIQALVDSAQKNGRKHIPYRDSKLTFLLKDALGGNSKTCLIATISPAEGSLSETASTLEFAQRCSAIKTAATINENLTSDVQELQEEVRRLRKLVHDLEDSGQIEAGMSKRMSVKRPEPQLTVIPLLPGRVNVPSRPSGQAVEQAASERAIADEESSRAERLQLITAGALAREEAVKLDLQEAQLRSTELSRRQEANISALRSVVELRDGELRELRDGSWTRDSGVRRLRREIELTKVQRDNHPEIARLSHELTQTRAKGPRGDGGDSRRFEDQLKLLARELEAALVENGTLRELATPRAGGSTDAPFAAHRGRDEGGKSGPPQHSMGRRGASAAVPPSAAAAAVAPFEVPGVTFARQASMMRGEKLMDLLSTLRVSVHNLEETITTATNTPRSVASPTSPMSPVGREVR
jgi:hypothetical protein